MTVSLPDFTPAIEPNALFVDPAWWAVLHATFGIQVRDLRSPGGDSLPYVEIDDILGRRRVSLPFCDIVDTTVDPQGWPDLVAPLLDDGVPLRLATGCRHPVVDDERFVTEIGAVHQVLGLDRPFDEVERSYAVLTRRMIRRAQRHGIRCRVSFARDDIHRFHDLHVTVRKRRHGLLAQPRSMFDAIGDRFVDAGRGCLVVGEIDGDVVGGCLVVAAENTLHYKFAASEPSLLPTGLSHAIAAAAIRHAADLGIARFDFGRSDLDQPGLVDFKRRFGTVAHPIATSRTHHEPPSVVRDRLHRLTELFVSDEIPDSLTAAAGAALYRYFA